MMKKILLTLLFMILFIPGVNADINADIANRKFIPLTEANNDTCSTYQGYYYYTDFDTFISDTNNKKLFDKLYDNIKNYYIENYQKTYPYYKISVALISKTSDVFDLYEVQIKLHFYKENQNSTLYSPLYISGTYDSISEVYTSTPYVCGSVYSHILSLFTYYDYDIKYFPLGLFEGNYNEYLASSNGNITVNLYDYSNNYITTYNSGDLLPYFIDSTYRDYFPKSYTEVNLDDYEYVILSLKNYNQSEAFETNMQVKGSIGITPVYEFGTVEKETITDICNTTYEDFTNYRFFVLKNDLLNNSLYYVKKCVSNSSFRFDNTIFNITYVTTANVDDPVITVDGVNYHTIPFDKLSNTVNKNEENNFIPGESGSSLGDIINNTTNYISSFWNSLTTFMGLVTKFFNTLPVEIRAISITMFTTAITLGVIKFIKS